MFGNIETVGVGVTPNIIGFSKGGRRKILLFEREGLGEISGLA